MKNDPKKQDNGGNKRNSRTDQYIEKGRFIGESRSQSEELRRGAEIVPRPSKGGGGKKNK